MMLVQVDEIILENAKEDINIRLFDNYYIKFCVANYNKNGICLVLITDNEHHKDPCWQDRMLINKRTVKEDIVRVVKYAYELYQERCLKIKK